jgi:transcription factor 1
LSVIAEASSHSFLSPPPEQLLLYLDHFHPGNVRIGLPSALRAPRSTNKRRGSPFVAVNIVPHDQQVCLMYEYSCLRAEFRRPGIQVIDKGTLDQWDYVLRRLFVLKSTPLRKAIGSLAPGAEVLLDMLTDKELPTEERVDIRLKVKHLTLSDWALIVRAFDAWPFAPSVRIVTSIPSRDLNSLGPPTQDLNIDSFHKNDRE